MVETLLDNQFTCSHCYTVHNLADRGGQYHGGAICQSCYTRYFATCADCDSLVLASDTYRISRRLVCSECEAGYTACDHCGGYVLSEAAYFIEDDDHLYCEDCHTNLTRQARPSKIDFTNNTYNILTTKRKYGIELETCKKNANKTLYFNIEEDGSIDGHEFVSPILEGDIGLKAIKDELDYSIRRCGTDETCGYHLHIDARDLTWNDIKKIYYTYKMFENMIYKMLPLSRRNGKWSKPIDSTKLQIEGILDGDTLIEGYYKQPKDTVDTKHKYDPKRYHGLNLHSYFYRGTIELRYHSGTTDYNKIEKWILLHQGLIEFSIRNTLPCIKEQLHAGQTAMRKLRKVLHPMYGSERTTEIVKYISDRATKFYRSNAVDTNDSTDELERTV